MFRDEATFTVRGGRGGDGIATFRREKYVPRGGPSGGDGGRGGDVTLLADPSVTTLLDFVRRREWAGGAGGRGGSALKHGSDGADLLLRVPVGTVVRDGERGHVLRDLAHPAESLLVARGGRGGRGNARFKSATNRTPRRFEKGEPGETRRLRLELKLIADVGLVGLPNAGKSTLLRRISAARPKVAGYPFTTLAPVLGIVQVDEERRLVFADIPGLIEGAHRGRGLGDAFLRHVERTRLLLHLVDASGDAPVPAAEAHAVVSRELRAYSKALSERPRIVVATKMDDPSAEEGARSLEGALRHPVLRVSALAGKGLEDLLRAVLAALEPRSTPAPGPVRPSRAGGTV